MKLKGTFSINRAMNSWLRKYGFATRVKGIDTDFYWYEATNTIGYSFIQSTAPLGAWDEVLTECGLKYEIAEFWTSFLHELGHGETWYQFSDEELDKDEEVKRWLKEEDESSFAESIHSIYFHLPTEIAATRWMVNFINTNPQAVMELTKMVTPKIQRFYKLNKITNN